MTNIWQRIKIPPTGLCFEFYWQIAFQHLTPKICNLTQNVTGLIKKNKQIKQVIKPQIANYTK